MWWLVVVAHAGEPCTGRAPVAQDGRFVEVERGIGFTTGQATLLPEVDLGPLVCALRADPALTLHVGVHSDSQGSDAFNLRMTQARADALRDALVAAGADGGRITASGYGETRPIASNSTAEGRAQNRRVELSTAPLPPPPAPAPPLVAEPAPRPAPAAPPAPARSADPCAPWSVVGTGLPWPGCAGTAGAFTCVRPEPPAALAAVAARCLGAEVLEDGAARYVRVGGGTLEVLPDGEGSRVRWP